MDPDIPTCPRAVARAAVLDVIARMNDDDVVALWALITSWVLTDDARPQSTSNS